ncbi:glycoside hydrolase family 78 protein [Pedobacter paludis]|uniref:alpha-L-rhamnosidase n=1 Tax=Pedobacter paludis TaxID=2203212 RepID=A0A317F4Y5_9SPHI|nr:glycoside hydrolase family 78 protein [Pedobacter paludis]PWS33383.1 alpha-L-rhamnosidase [Pedobacter paludis]
MRKSKLIALIGLLLLLASSTHAQKLIWQVKWIQTSLKEDSLRAAQYFSKAFITKSAVKSATLYITARGMYEANINGKRVGDAYLSPGWTSYDKRIAYQSYNVSDLLKKGENKLNVILGDGWYRGAIGFEERRDYYGKTLALLCQLEVKYKNGKKEIIGSDESWRCGEGPIRFSEINNGETIDARVAVKTEMPVVIANFNYQGLFPSENEPIRKHELFKPKLLITPKGEKVLDFGQNLTGWIAVKAKGPAGTTISLEHGEVLDNKGNFYMGNMRKARVKATYILAGNGAEYYEPHFTYFGFRYARVTGYPGEISPDDFEGISLYSDVQSTGSFTCSNPLINQLQSNITWSQRGNFLDVPTDCPQRDERLGWTGDAQVFFRTAAFNYRVDKFFNKWLEDMALDQGASGIIPSVIPNMYFGADGSAGWADAATIIPWQHYLVYGDKASLARHYPMMKKWVDYVKGQSQNDLWRSGWQFGDWLSYRPMDDNGTEAVTDKFQIAQCFWAHSTQNLINAAKALGRTEDVVFYSALLERIKIAFLKEYFTPNGRLMSNTQTAYVLALHFDMLPENARTKAAAYLVENIRAYEDHLTTGFLGTPYLCEVLTRFGYPDVAYQLLNQKTYPSWLFSVTKGATTIWERWNAVLPTGEFYNPHMNSFNHYAYGAIGDWLYRTVAGINTDTAGVGYKKIIIKPIPGGGLTWVKANYLSKYGKITANWKITGGRLSLDVEIPEGTTAEILVPSVDGKDFQLHQVIAGKYHYER